MTGPVLTVAPATVIGVSLGLPGGGSILAVPLHLSVARLPAKEAIATGKLRHAGPDARNLTGGTTARERAGPPMRTDDGRDGTVA